MTPKTSFNARLCILLLLCTLSPESGYPQHLSADALRPLQFMLGEWDVEVDARLSKSGPWEKSKGLSVITWIAGKSVIQDEFTGTRQGRELTATAWLANDNRTRRYQRVFVDSDHGALVMYEGQLTGKLMTLLADFELNNVRVLLRSQYHLISIDKFSVESARSTDNGATWDRTLTMSYSRKGPDREKGPDKEQGPAP